MVTCSERLLNIMFSYSSFEQTGNIPELKLTINYGMVRKTRSFRSFELLTLLHLCMCKSLVLKGLERLQNMHILTYYIN